jgi:hypothetical protein
VHDTADLEQRGVPAVFVSTVEFVDGADAQAQALGFEHTAVYTQHPIQDRSDEEMREIADEAVDAIIDGLIEA